MDLAGNKSFKAEEIALKEAHDNLQKALSLFSQKAQEAFDAIHNHGIDINN